MRIEQIENLTEETIKPFVLDRMKIKEHDCYFCHFGEYFGYSMAVFKNGKHIYYANDYQLHHTEKDKKALKMLYIKIMNHKLFTDAELLEGCKNYDEYTKKNHFLRNYWIMRYDTLSIFGIGEEAEKRFEARRPEYPFFNRVCFCYVKDESIVHDAHMYLKSLEGEFKRLQEDDDTFRQMIRRELENYEACISMDYRDALDALGLKFSELSSTKQRIVQEELSRQIQLYG